MIWSIQESSPDPLVAAFVQKGLQVREKLLNPVSAVFFSIQDCQRKFEGILKGKTNSTDFIWRLPLALRSIAPFFHNSCGVYSSDIRTLASNFHLKKAICVAAVIKDVRDASFNGLMKQRQQLTA